MKKIKIIIIILSFFNIISCSDIKIPNRDMIILIENLEIENLENSLNKIRSKDFKEPEPSGIGAITGTYLIAMHQEAAPILANKSIVINALKHKDLFNNFLELSIKDLAKKYLNTEKFKKIRFLKKYKNCCIYSLDRFKQINKEIKDFIDKNNIDNKLIESKVFSLIKDKRFNEKYAPYNAKSSIHSEMIINIICYSINYDNWILKEVDDNFCLLIPKKYLDKLSLRYEDIKYKNYKKKSENKLTTTEINFGLKLNHLKDIKFKDLVNKNKKFINIIETFKKLFINKNKSKDIVWNFYATGHGYYESFDKIFIAQLEKLRSYYRSKLKVKSKFENKYLENLRVVNKEIKKLKSLEYLPLVNNVDILSGVILSMSKEDFRNLLIFFNNYINTAFFCYESCFSGGKHLIEPYKDLVLNYDVVSGSVSENLSMQLMPLINIPPYYYKNNSENYKINFCKDSIDFKNKKLKLYSSLKFKKYFKKLRNSENRDYKFLKELLDLINPYNYIEDYYNITLISNISLIRLKGQENFHIARFKDETISIINENNISDLNKKVNLVYLDYIPKELEMNKNPEAIISMIPEFSAHVFESINAPSLELEEVIRPFLYFKENPVPKLFWIKRLKYKDREIKDLIITRNIVNTNRLKDLNKENISAYIYFTDNKSNNLDIFYKIKWPDLNIDNFNIKDRIIKYNSYFEKQNYKDELLLLKPNLKSFI